MDSKRRITDFPPAGLNTDGVPTGGWWNYSGIQREVYLRKLDTVDFRKVLVRPVLPCGTCDATIQARINLKNVTRRGQRATITGKFGSQNLRLGTKTIGPDGIMEFADNITVRNPRLWAPGSPNLYDVSFTVRVGGEKVAGYELKSGIRSIKVSNGRLFLNGQALNTRGLGLHEDSKAQGFAIDNARREELLNQAKELGATSIRTHYPFHPYTHELADRMGILIWSEIPVYTMKTQVLKEPAVRRLAVEELRRNIEANENHPSVMLWSIGNELSSQPGPVQVSYIDAAVKFAKEMDPTRPVGIAVAAYPSSLCQAAQYKSIDVLGLNDYFGWYPGPSGQIFDRTKLGRLPRRGPRLLPGQGADGHRVRRRGQPRRPGRGEGHVGLPAGVGQLPARHLRHQAVAQRRDVLGAERVLGPAGLGGRQSPPALTDPPEGPRDLRRRPQAGLRRRAALLHDDAAADRAYREVTRRRAGAGSDGVRVRTRRRRRVGELVVTGPQAAVRLDGEGQRDAARRGGLRLVGDAVVAAASRIVLIVWGPVRRAVGTKEHQEERAAKHEGHEVENAEDHEQLRVGGHCSMNTHPGRDANQSVRCQVRYHARPLAASIFPARDDHLDHGRLHEAFPQRPRSRGLAYRPAAPPLG